MVMRVQFRIICNDDILHEPIVYRDAVTSKQKSFCSLNELFAWEYQKKVSLNMTCLYVYCLFLFINSQTMNMCFAFEILIILLIVRRLNDIIMNEWFRVFDAWFLYISNSNQISTLFILDIYR